MILADTSVWIDHFRRGNMTLQGLLEEGEVLTHPYIVGELACGSFASRDTVLNLLQALPEAPIAHHAEVMALIEGKRLWGKGIGWIDAHLLASALLIDCRLWTLDKKLSTISGGLGVAM